MTGADDARYRSYEVYQRERVGETTKLVNPRALIGDEYLDDPFTISGVVREHYPCYRDWIGNRFWITRYDDVTSIFTDDANFETRPKAWSYDGAISGRDLGGELAFRQMYTEAVDAHLGPVIDDVLNTFDGDIAAGFATRLAVELEARALGLASDQASEFGRYRRELARGASWHDAHRLAGIEGAAGIASMLQPILDTKSTYVGLGASSTDIVATLLEADHDTLACGLANLWCLLLTYPEQLERVQQEPRLMKLAYLEALRHSPPVISADRYARHEVERFGRLLPEGALLHLSAAAANRDPRQFADPDSFDITRKDLCQREPRGQYRADGLPAAVAFGHGKPSRLPAMPRDVPRSAHALTRDVAVAASTALLERFPDIALAPGFEPAMKCDRLGAPYACAQLLVR